jgi:UDP-N-acetylglucosamine--N-acetylmuramyl-(pentapeptide) pyrophosphoryl-undecaprenol N-acetylglucosamine transferase
MIRSAPSIVLAAGGTAGHIEPALTLADEIIRQAPQARITVIGSDRGLEATLVPARGYRLVQVPATPMPRRVSIDLVRLPTRIEVATRRARSALMSAEAEVVVGFGGYGALPAYLAARRCRVPLVIHEANAKAGLANRLGARLTSHVYATYPDCLPGALEMGLPLRPVIARLNRGDRRSEARRYFDLPDDQPLLLVFGGSQGAQHINGVLALALDSLLAAGVCVLHAYGAANVAPVERPGYRAVPYLDRMDLAYAAADFALVRAGAMTCAELAAVGLPAAYVPLGIGNGEQRLNALPVVRAGGGLLVENQDLTAQWLAATIPGLLHDPARLAQMSDAAHRRGVPDAAPRLASVVLGIAGRREDEIRTVRPDDDQT